MHRIHKWIAVTAGAFILTWLISGIVMTIPISWLKRLIQSDSVQEAALGQEIATRGGASSQVDFRDIRISIPQAISAVESDLGQEVRVIGVKVARLATGIAYEIALEDGRQRLVDALTGTRVTITHAMAERIARAAVPNGGEIVNTALLSRRDYHYSGSLPVYKILFGDARRTLVYVSAATGQIEQSSQFSRTHAWVTSIHTFEPVRLISEHNAIRVGLLVFFSVVGIGAVCTGFYLALPVRLRRSQIAGRAIEAREGKKRRVARGSTFG